MGFEGIVQELVDNIVAQEAAASDDEDGAQGDGVGGLGGHHTD